MLDHAHDWMTRLAMAAVGVAWVWIAWQRRKTGRKIARRTLAMMIAASLMTMTAASWPLLEPALFKAPGIVKKTVSQVG